jgi:hypothetical protein
VLSKNNTNDAFTNLRGLIIMSKKIATLITDLFEDVEFTESAQAFKDAGQSSDDNRHTGWKRYYW